MGERRPQSNSGEYVWLGSDVTRNTQGRYIPIFPRVVIMITPPGLLLTISCAEVIIICICSVVKRVNPPPPTLLYV